MNSDKKTWTIEYNKRYSEIWIKLRRDNYYHFFYNETCVDTKKLITLFNASSIIDYGCGNAISTRDIKNISVFKFDPFVEEYKTRPTECADLVIAYNVLSTVEIEHLEAVIEDIFNFSNDVVVFSIPISKRNEKTSEWYLNKVKNEDFDMLEHNEIDKVKFYDATKRHLSLSESNTFLYLYFRKKLNAKNKFNT